MPRFPLRSLVLTLSWLPLVAGAGRAHADVSLFAPDTYTAWLDVRTHASDGETNWRDGGYGKLRYGDDHGLDLAQAAVLWTPRLSDTVTGHVLLQDVPDAQQPLGISEAYVRWKPVPTSATRYAVRLGQMFLPVSLEHDGPGWSTTRTLTPSAINSWIGEEGLVTGVEGTVQQTLGDHRIGATLGLFTGDDTAGTVLAFRGWAQHDIASAGNAGLRLPDGGTGGYTTVFLKQARISRPMVEVDGRGGYYLRLDWQPPAPVAFNLFYFYNPGTTTIVKHGQYGWATRFIEGGLQYRVAERDHLLAQALWGRTKMGAVDGDGLHPADVAFQSGYVLLTHDLGGDARLAARIDYFQVIDDSLVDLDNNNELGYSATLAWTRPLSPHLGLTVEATQTASDRPARAAQYEASRQAQTVVQLALKVHL